MKESSRTKNQPCMEPTQAGALLEHNRLSLHPINIFFLFFTPPPPPPNIIMHVPLLWTKNGGHPKSKMFFFLFLIFIGIVYLQRNVGLRYFGFARAGSTANLGPKAALWTFPGGAYFHALQAPFDQTVQLFPESVDGRPVGPTRSVENSGAHLSIISRLPNLTVDLNSWNSLHLGRYGLISVV